MAYTYPFRDVADNIIRAVWNKGRFIKNYAPDLWRRDICGHTIKYTEHGKEGLYGWEIDHINPSANGGPDTLDNLQPLWWSHNRKKSDAYPWVCP